MGHYITVLTDETGVVTEDKYKRAKEKDYKTDICETTLAPLSERDIAFLLAMAEDDGESKISKLPKRISVSDAYVQTYKRRLIQAAVIEQPKRGMVRFAVPYIREYLLANYSD